MTDPHAFHCLLNIRREDADVQLRDVRCSEVMPQEVGNDLAGNSTPGQVTCCRPSNIVSLEAFVLECGGFELLLQPELRASSPSLQAEAQSVFSATSSIPLDQVGLSFSSACHHSLEQSVELRADEDVTRSLLAFLDVHCSRSQIDLVELNASELRLAESGRPEESHHVRVELAVDLVDCLALHVLLELLDLGKGQRAELFLALLLRGLGLDYTWLDHSHHRVDGDPVVLDCGVEDVAECLQVVMDGPGALAGRDQAVDVGLDLIPGDVLDQDLALRPDLTESLMAVLVVLDRVFGAALLLRDIDHEIHCVPQSMSARVREIRSSAGHLASLFECVLVSLELRVSDSALAELAELIHPVCAPSSPSRLNEAVVELARLVLLAFGGPHRGRDLPPKLYHGKALGPAVVGRDGRKSLCRKVIGGGRGIRTPGRLSPSLVFKTNAFGRSAIPPHCPLGR